MIITKKIGALQSIDIGARTIDVVPVQWHEAGKRILHLKTKSGIEIILRFLNNPSPLQQDDVLYEDAQTLVVVDIEACAVIVLQPKTLYEMAAVCYEIGNKHLPLFYENNELLIPFEAPIFRMLQAAGFNAAQQQRKLLHPLKTTVSPHGHAMERESLFSKILKLTTPDGP